MSDTNGTPSKSVHGTPIDAENVAILVPALIVGLAEVGCQLFALLNPSVAAVALLMNRLVPIFTTVVTPGSGLTIGPGFSVI